MPDEIKNKEQNMLDGTTWEFLNAGWWIFHVIAIIAAIWIGAMFF